MLCYLSRDSKTKKFMEQHVEYYDVELEQDSTNDALLKHGIRVHVCVLARLPLQPQGLHPDARSYLFYFHTVDHTNMLASSSDRLKVQSRNWACGVGMPTMLRVVMCMCTHACTYMLSYFFLQDAAQQVNHGTPQKRPRGAGDPSPQPLKIAAVQA